MREELEALAVRCEGAAPSKELDRLIALEYGWCRLTPSEAGRRHPAWFHPDDCRDGKPVYDSLHGTDVWRDPLAYTTSIDAAMTLVPEGAPWSVIVTHPDGLAVAAAAKCGHLETASHSWRFEHEAEAATPALALCAVSLRARARALEARSDETVQDSNQ